ncbi:MULTISPECIES: phage tail protein [unclassified Thalassospira]|uniref:phage tail protein n=1 Tax=unclassified Thalassospira TaxID=2648997 RepID=UPI0007A5DCAD|nr:MULTISPECIES: phage tail protein [unclassified Thalassospira]KZC99681.1 hypothetical protein AUQ41_08360 [Thalassospira sp. MCCC 1A02898]ONH85395.1 hypothetical protein TH47_05990 [Thalassospira sp. MCCC 1A02803]
MAQHDYVAANGSGAVVRGDFNDAFLAVATMNSGASAPSTTYAYMAYVNTSDGHLYQRNAANTGWIDHGTVASRFLRLEDVAAGGSAGLLRADGDGSGLSGLAALPVGSVFWFGAEDPPSGALACDGAAISRVTYSSLFAVLGTAFGAGDGSTTFNLPDLRGEFVRGWDDGRGVDAARVFGSSQADSLSDHKHQSGVQWSSSNPDILYYDDPDTGFGLGDATDTTLDRYASGGSGGAPSSAASYLLTDVPYSASVSGETRGRNVALLACVKY